MVCASKERKEGVVYMSKKGKEGTVHVNDSVGWGRDFQVTFPAGFSIDFVVGSWQERLQMVII